MHQFTGPRAIVDELLERMASDPDFRRELLANPDLAVVNDGTADGGYEVVGYRPPRCPMTCPNTCPKSSCRISF